MANESSMQARQFLEQTAYEPWMDGLDRCAWGNSNIDDTGFQTRHFIAYSGLKMEAIYSRLSNNYDGMLINFTENFHLTHPYSIPCIYCFFGKYFGA